MESDGVRSETAAEGESGTATGAASDCDVALYLRASPTAVGKRRQERVEERLRGLAEADRLGSLTVDHWPGQMRVRAGEQSPVADAYDDLAAAAERAGARLAPFFDDREGVDGMIQSNAGTRIITIPVISVVVERDGEVVGLYPCRRDGIHHRVEEAVDALAAGEVPDNLR